MYDAILVPVIFDPERSPDQALAVAKQLANEGAHITLLHVIEALPAYAASYVALDYIERSHDETLAKLKEIAAPIEGGQAAVIHGHSARSILDWARESGSDCIIVSSHQPGMQDYFLGGTAARVVRYAPCAVHVIR